MKVALKNVRLAFPALFQPQSVNGSDPRFSGVFIMEPDSPNVKALETAMKDVAVAKWGDKGEKILAKLKKDKRVCLQDGDDKTNKEGDVYDGFEGMMCVSANRDSRPLLLDRDKTELSQADGKPYAGCYVNASIELWAQDNKYGQRVNASLRGVQFFKDGDAFAGGTPVSEDEFDDLSDGADADDLDDDLA